MTALFKTLGRGLVILALASCAFACGDDDGGGKTHPDGGAGTGDTDGGGGTGGGSSVATCVADAQEVTMNMTSEACLTCACTEGSEEVAGCGANCWALIDCFGTADKCGDVDTADTEAAITCASTKCPMVQLGMAVADGPMAEALGTVISNSCSTQCSPAGSPDGGAGSGGSGGAGGAGGGDADAGDDTDGGGA